MRKDFGSKDQRHREGSNHDLSLECSGGNRVAVGCSYATTEMLSHENRKRGCTKSTRKQYVGVDSEGSKR